MTRIACVALALLLADCGSTEPSPVFGRFALTHCIFDAGTLTPVPCAFADGFVTDSIRYHDGAVILSSDSSFTQIQRFERFISGVWQPEITDTLHATYSFYAGNGIRDTLAIHFPGDPPFSFGIAVVHGRNLDLYDRLRFRR